MVGSVKALFPAPGAAIPSEILVWINDDGSAYELIDRYRLRALQFRPVVVSTSFERITARLSARRLRND